MKTNSKLFDLKAFKAKWGIVEVPTVKPNPFHPLSGKTASLGGQKYIDTKFEYMNEIEIKTTRAVSSKFNPSESEDTLYNAYRACDTYPQLVDYGTVALNISGAHWAFDEASSTFTPNAPAVQLETECANIDATLRSRQYTDLPILDSQYEPYYPNNADYFTSKWTRFFIALDFNTKVFIKLYKKFDVIMQWLSHVQHQSNVASIKANEFVKEAQKATFIGTLASFNAALNQLPASKYLVETYPKLFDLEVNGEGMTSSPTFVDPTIFPYFVADGEFGTAWADMARLTILKNTTPLIFNSVICQQAEEALSLWDFAKHFYTDDAAAWVQFTKDTINDFRARFATLSLAIGAVAAAFQPFLTAIEQLQGKFFDGYLIPHMSIEQISSSRAINANTIQSLAFAGSFAIKDGVGDYARVKVGTIPLFNSFTPVNILSENNLLAYKGSSAADGYASLVDVTGLGLKRAMVLLNNQEGNYDESQPEGSRFTMPVTYFSYTNVNLCDLYTSSWYAELVVATDPTYHIPTVPVKSVPFTNCFKLVDIGLMRWLNYTQWAYRMDIVDQNHTIPVFNRDFTGFRSISYTPIDPIIIASVGKKYGIGAGVQAAVS